VEQLPHHRDIRLHFGLPPLQKPRIEGPDGLVVLDGDQGGHEQRTTNRDIAAGKKNKPRFSAPCLV